MDDEAAEQHYRCGAQPIGEVFPNAFEGLGLVDGGQFRRSRCCGSRFDGLGSGLRGRFVIGDLCLCGRFGDLIRRRFRRCRCGCRCGSIGIFRLFLRRKRAEEGGGEQQADQREDAREERDHADEGEHFLHPPGLVAFLDVISAFGSAECGVEEVDDSLRAVHGIVYLRMDAGHFVDGSERTGSCLAACDLGEDAVHIDAAVDHVAFAACDADIALCGLGGEPLAGDGAAVFVGGVEELVIHGFQEADGDVAARAHECAPGLDETRGDDADGSVLHESHRGGEAAHGVTGDADLVLVDVIEVVEILRAVVKTARRHQRA